MLDKESYILAELLGRDDPKVQSLIWAAKNPAMRDTVRNMFRNMAMQMGWDPDNPPKFALPGGISPSDYVVGTAMSGNVQGKEVGPSDVDLHSHVGIFGITFTGKSTLVKLLLLAFTKNSRLKSGRKHTFFIWDRGGEYRDLLLLYEPDEIVWLTADDLGINPLEVPTNANGQLVMSPDKWINNIREWLRLLWLNEPSCNLFCEVLRKEYCKRGILGGNDE